MIRRPALYALALFAGATALQFEPAILRDVVLADGQGRIGAVRTSLWTLASAQEPQDVTLQNIEIAVGKTVYRADRIVLSGLASPRDEIEALLKSPSGSLADRVARIAVKKVSIPELKVSTEFGGEKQNATYRNVVLNDVVGGKIRVLTLDSMEAVGGNGTTATVTGKSLLKDFDAALGVRIFEPQPAGPGLAMAKLYGEFEAQDVVLTDLKSKVRIALAKISGRDVMARPITQSWNGASDLIARAEANDDLTPEETSTLLRFAGDILDSFDFGLIQASGIEITSTPDPKTLRTTIARLSYAGTTDGKPAEISLEGLEATDKNGRVAIAGMNLKGFSLRPTLDGLKALPPVDEIDSSFARKLFPSMGTFTLYGLEIDTITGDEAGPATRVRSTLKRFEIAGDTPREGIPTGLRIALQNFTMTLPGQSEEDGLKDLIALGYRNLDLSFLLSGRWNEATSEFGLSDLTFEGVDMANVSVSGSLGNVSKDVFDPDRAVASVALMAARVKQLDVRIDNKGLFERYLAKTATEEKTTPDALLQLYGAGATVLIPSVIGSSEQAKKISQAISQFMSKPGALILRARSRDASGIGMMSLLTTTDPKALLQKLDVSATAE